MHDLVVYHGAVVSYNGAATDGGSAHGFVAKRALFGARKQLPRICLSACPVRRARAYVTEALSFDSQARGVSEPARGTKPHSS
jgi:hypothetical protein